MTVEISHFIGEYVTFERQSSDSERLLPNADISFYSVRFHVQIPIPGLGDKKQTSMELKKKQFAPNKKEVVIATYSDGSFKVGFLSGEAQLNSHTKITEAIVHSFGLDDLVNIFHGYVEPGEKKKGRNKSTHSLVLLKVNQEALYPVELKAARQQLPSGLLYPERIMASHPRVMDDLLHAFRAQSVKFLALPKTDFKGWIYTPEQRARLLN